MVTGDLTKFACMLPWRELWKFTVYLECERAIEQLEDNLFHLTCTSKVLPKT